MLFIELSDLCKVRPNVMSHLYTTQGRWFIGIGAKGQSMCMFWYNLSHRNENLDLLVRIKF